MTLGAEQLDRRFARISSLFAEAKLPPKGWVKAIRTSLGMTTGQMAARMSVSQPRVSELERAEMTGAVTMHSLERAAEALGCRLVYALVPIRPLATVMEERASAIADEKMAHVHHTMVLEDQATDNPVLDRRLKARMVAELLDHPRRLWAPSR